MRCPDEFHETLARSRNTGLDLHELLAMPDDCPTCGLGTVDEPDWPAIQRRLAAERVIPWWYGLTRDEVAEEVARRVMDAAKLGPGS